MRLLLLPIPALVLVAPIAWGHSASGQMQAPTSDSDPSRDPPRHTILSEGFGEGWQERWSEESLDSRDTDYSVVQEGGNPVLLASSLRSASALTRSLSPAESEDVEARPGLRISWSWRITEGLGNDHDERNADGDDYAARVFVIFGSGNLASADRALLYVWAASEPVGTTYRSPVVDEVATFVLRSGSRRVGEWIRETRDVHADYREAFGEEPGPVAGVALMVDSDDTGSRATARFDDLELVAGR